jgi:hypothetical protein
MGAHVAAQSRTLEICGLNIVASPHPNGIYIDLLNAAAGRSVRARGSDWAKITKPKPGKEPGFYEGRIIVWTAIDLDGRWLDAETDEELSAADRKKISIPDKAKPNFRVFSYVFNDKRHRLYYESRNEFGETLGPTVARRIFGNLLCLPKRKVDVEVTIIPQEGAVNKILALPALRTLEIKLLLPNADGVDRKKQEDLYKKLRAMKARSLEQILQKQAGEARLAPDKETQELAHIAAENGYVKGDGGRGDNRVQLSTADTPQRKRVSMDEGTNLLSRLVASKSLF